MLRLFHRTKTMPYDGTSRLLDQDTFYEAFIRDIRHITNEIIIESPFITISRVNKLLPYFRKLRSNNVSIVINTRHPDEHDPELASQAEQAIKMLRIIGVRVLYTGGHHRKLAIIDRATLYEGSLNILSQNDSCEVMRRIESSELAQEMINFTKLNKFLR